MEVKEKAPLMAVSEARQEPNGKDTTKTAGNNAAQGKRTNGIDFEALKTKYRITPTAEIKRPPVLIRIGKSPAIAAGDISTLTGKGKSGKTRFLSGLVAAAISGACPSFINITGSITGSIIYINTEQSKYYATATIQRICKLAGAINQPRLFAYQLRNLDPATRLKLIENIIYSTPGAQFIVIDGIRDLMSKGINDEEEATSLVSKLMKWSGELNAHVLCVLHQNKGNDMVRGHIGTEMINKSGAVIEVSKSDVDKNTFIVRAERTRDVDFDEFAFSINDEGLPELAAMPDRATMIKESKMKKIVSHLEFIFGKGKPIIPHGELSNEYAELAGVALVTAKRHVGEAWKAGKVIKMESGLYKLPTNENEPACPY